MKRSIIRIIILFLLIFPITANAKTSKNIVNIYFFHSKTCPHCQEENQKLKQIEQKYENVKVYRYEMHEEKNKIILNEVKRVYAISTDGVPITIIGSQVYIGFTKEKSTIKMIKAIEYYSRYSYDDKVMKIISPNAVSNYHESPYIKRESFNKFIKEYHNYNVLGLKTDNLEPNIIAFLIGIVSCISVIFLITMFVVLILLHRVVGFQDKIVLLSIYLFVTFVLRVNTLLHNNLFNTIVNILLLVVFMYAIIRYYKSRRRQYGVVNVLIIVSIISEYLNTRIYNKQIVILKDIVSLHLLDGLDKISYYGNYFVCIFLIDIALILIIYLFFQKKLIKT